MKEELRSSSHDIKQAIILLNKANDILYKNRFFNYTGQTKIGSTINEYIDKIDCIVDKLSELTEI